jgi:hypothetical protein
VQVGQQRDAEAHRHGHLVVAGHRACGLRQMTVVAARGLRTVQLPLAGVDFRHARGAHGFRGRVVRPKLCIELLSKGRRRWTPVAKTAYYCCGIRAMDARDSDPLCGDHLAERFMDPEGSAAFERFAALEAQNVANVARHRIIDDLLKARLRA